MKEREEISMTHKKKNTFIDYSLKEVLLRKRGNSP